MPPGTTRIARSKSSKVRDSSTAIIVLLAGASCVSAIDAVKNVRRSFQHAMQRSPRHARGAVAARDGTSTRFIAAPPAPALHRRDAPCDLRNYVVRLVA